MVARSPFRVSSSRGHLLNAIDPLDGLSVYLIPRSSIQALSVLAAAPPLTIMPGAAEVTERRLIDLQAASRNLAELRARGHRVLIDDFGTGYSSLAYLQTLPVNGLKIDKTFIDALGGDAASSGIVPHIVRMARALRLKVIAEGIEHEEQAHLLGSEGCRIWPRLGVRPAAECACIP